MTTFLIALHVMVCIVLVTVVLLQRGKGADMGAAFGGGGANTVFGGRGAGNFLTKLTSACAAIFMLTSISLAYVNLHDEGGQIFDSDSQANSEAPVAAGDSEASGASANTLQEIPQPAKPTSAEPDGADETDGAGSP